MIRKATENDIPRVEAGYLEHLRHEQTRTAYTVWKEGVYPTKQTALDALAEGSLYVMDDPEGTGADCVPSIASVIADQKQPAAYADIDWSCPAEPEDVLVIHLLCVPPSLAGHGIGSSIVRFLIEEARAQGYKTVRLDTGGQNIPAASLYRKLGFRLAGTGGFAVGGVISHANHLFFEYPLQERG